MEFRIRALWAFGLDSSTAALGREFLFYFYLFIFFFGGGGGTSGFKV